MGYYTEFSNSSYAAKDTALTNRLNGVNGHTVLGTLLVGCAQNISSIGEQLAGKKGDGDSSYGPEPQADNVISVKEQANNRGVFNKAFGEFQKNPTRATAKALEDALMNCSTNTTREALKLCKQNYPNLFS